MRATLISADRPESGCFMGRGRTGESVLMPLPADPLFVPLPGRAHYDFGTQTGRGDIAVEL
ncbi:MAG: hypothetical protein AAEJ43_00100 [Gammaproteobacteria bacterium]